LERVGHASVEECLRSDNCHVNLFFCSYLQHISRVKYVDLNEPGDLSDSGISWRAEHVRDAWVAREPPGEGVFPAAAAKNQNPHQMGMII
jgi:hypothetical protein